MSAYFLKHHRSPLLKNAEADLLPPIADIQNVSRVIALKVAQAAIADGVAVPLTDEQIQSNIEKEFWQPEYRTYKRVPF